MGAATYLDGVRPLRREAAVVVEGETLVIRDVAGEELARWPLGEVRHLHGRPAGLLLGREGPDGPGADRLEIGDPGLRAAIEAACPALDRRARWSAREIARVAALSAAALASIAGVLFIGIPLAADRIAPFVPARVEANIGRIAESQLRLLLRPRGGRFECDGAAGRAALEALTQRLVAGDAYAVPPRIAVLDIRVPNAIALPGGQIYLFRGLLQRAEGPDEVVSVLAHELGHVHARHGMRAMLQTGSTSFIVGLFVGDFAGAGAVAFVMRGLVNAGYSREAEREADNFAVDVMLRHGGDARALGRFLARIVADLGGESGASYFDSHPVTPERAAAIEARLSGRTATASPSMTPEAWAALRSICD